MHQCIKFIHSGTALYMFRTVFPSIIRSSRLYIQQQAFVKQILLSACQQAHSSICLICRAMNTTVVLYILFLEFELILVHVSEGFMN